MDYKTLRKAGAIERTFNEIVMATKALVCDCGGAKAYIVVDHDDDEYRIQIHEDTAKNLLAQAGMSAHAALAQLGITMPAPGEYQGPDTEQVQIGDTSAQTVQ